MRVTSYELKASKHDLRFQSTSWNSNQRVTSPNPLVASSNPRDTSSIPRVTSSNPRVQESLIH